MYLKKNTNKIHHIIDDESDDENELVSWENEDTQNTEDSDSEEETIDEDDEIVTFDDIKKEKLTKMDLNGIKDKKKKKKEKDQEINFEVVKDDNKNKSVKVSINLDLEETDNVINVEFSISKEIFLRIANELK